jgi:hypothetical protein
MSQNEAILDVGGLWEVSTERDSTQETEEGQMQMEAEMGMMPSLVRHQGQ